ncbi:MAG: hypothetical protein MPJ79_02340 [Alphaproteobacteria bacterium]|nr:hypothetical protein [Alphaproteobacteria bacterium]MDA7988415.1 hypothetical protein [Alphaproteobacteria bacterium]MDA8008808.1 hypothetical protein [Alphaproteobacteria bacterium]
MNKFGFLIAVASAMFLAGCVQQQPLAYQTTHGKPERTLANTDIETAKGRLIDGCLRMGFANITEQGSSVICERTIDGASGVFAQFLVGNSYSTTPTQHVQFVFRKSGEHTTVTATRQWIQTQMAFGQINSQELTANQNWNDIHHFLRTLP